MCPPHVLPSDEHNEWFADVDDAAMVDEEDAMQGVCPTPSSPFRSEGTARVHTALQGASTQQQAQGHLSDTSVNVSNEKKRSGCSLRGLDGVPRDKKGKKRRIIALLTEEQRERVRAKNRRAAAKARARKREQKNAHIAEEVERLASNLSALEQLQQEKRAQQESLQARLARLTEELMQVRKQVSEFKEAPLAPYVEPPDASFQKVTVPCSLLAMQNTTDGQAAIADSTLVWPPNAEKFMKNAMTDTRSGICLPKSVSAENPGALAVQALRNDLLASDLLAMEVLDNAKALERTTVGTAWDSQQAASKVPKAPAYGSEATIEHSVATFLGVATAQDSSLACVPQQLQSVNAYWATLVACCESLKGSRDANVLRRIPMTAAKAGAYNKVRTDMLADGMSAPLPAGATSAGPGLRRAMDIRPAPSLSTDVPKPPAQPQRRASRVKVADDLLLCDRDWSDGLGDGPDSVSELLESERRSSRATESDNDFDDASLMLKPSSTSVHSTVSEVALPTPAEVFADQSDALLMHALCELHILPGTPDVDNLTRLMTQSPDVYSAFDGAARAKRYVEGWAPSRAAVCQLCPSLSAQPSDASNELHSETDDEPHNANRKAAGAALKSAGLTSAMRQMWPSCGGSIVAPSRSLDHTLSGLDALFDLLLRERLASDCAQLAAPSHLLRHQVMRKPSQLAPDAFEHLSRQVFKGLNLSPEQLKRCAQTWDLYKASHLKSDSLINANAQRLHGLLTELEPAGTTERIDLLRDTLSRLRGHRSLLGRALSNMVRLRRVYLLSILTPRQAARSQVLPLPYREDVCHMLQLACAQLSTPSPMLGC